MLPLLNADVISISSFSRSSISRIILGGLDIESETQCIDFLEYQNVRIMPSFLKFSDAFEGKTYQKKLILQNCGRSSAFIRICSPNSYAFKIKALVRGQRLPPGMSIVRYISYTYICAQTLPVSWIPIYINDQLIEYKLKVSLSQVMISAIPHKIDFGTINAGHSAAVRMLSLRNDGSKGTRFAIDLGRNDFELLVEPAKGVIQARDTVTFRVECLGTKEGPFSREFWIKCESPLRIEVTGDIIRSCFQSFHPNSTQDFTLIDFPRTYFGTSCVRMLVVKNFSATPAMYCTLVSLTGQTMNFEEACKIDPDFLDFKMRTKEGGLLSQQGGIFQYTYEPAKQSKRTKEKCSFCCLQIVRVPCITVNQIDTCEIATVQDQEQLFCSETCDTYSGSSTIAPFEDESSLLEVRKPSLTHHETLLPLTSVVRVMLYGEAEVAEMTIRPDALDLGEIPNNIPTARELLLKNESSTLPIIFRYKKVCFVEVDPPTGQLGPAGKLEVCVTVTPAKIGDVSTKIGFDLLFYDRPRDNNNGIDYVLVGDAEIPLVFFVSSTVAYPKTKFNRGITPTYIKEVGIFADEVRFDAQIEMPKAALIRHTKQENKDLIAFPNDRPKSLRYRKTSAKFRTIFAGIPRVVSAKQSNLFELTDNQRDKREQLCGYYENYLRDRRNDSKKLAEESKSEANYEHFVKETLLAGKVIKPKCPSRGKDKNQSKFSFIPLMPSQLLKIKVQPDDIKLGKEEEVIEQLPRIVATSTTSSKTITIKNGNNFSIRIYAKPRKPVLCFPDGDRKVAKPHQEAKITFVFNSGVFVGRYNVLLDIILNDNHAYIIPITADVIPKSVKLDVEDVVFESDGNRFRYLDISNPVNVPVEFRWQLPESCFTIEPQQATIPAKRRITCCITYNPHHIMPSATEATLWSEGSSRHQAVNIIANLRSPTVILRDQVVEFQDMPLNLLVEGCNSIKNMGTESVTFVVLNPEPMEGIFIDPIEGIFQGCGEQVFHIELKIAACVRFECAVQIELQSLDMIEFKIVGNVVYPQITITPNQITLKKIIPNAFDRREFVVANRSSAETTVEFSMEDYLEYTILDDSDFDWNKATIRRIRLQPHEERELFIHFNPIGPALYSFYLPIVINNLLGLPVLNLKDTLVPANYMAQAEADYLVSNKNSRVDTPSTLPTLIVSSVSTGDILRFSKLYLNFKHFPGESFLSETAVDLKIWNGAKDTPCRFCIRTDELHHPFFLQYVEGKEVELLEYSLVCTLEPEEAVVLKASFSPNIPGTYSTKLPIYLRDYQQCSVFNYLQFDGWYPTSKIEASETEIVFEPTPVKCNMEYRLSLKVSYHESNCKLQAESDFEEMVISLLDSSQGPEMNREVGVVLRCNLQNAQSFNSTIRFYCTCYVECLVRVNGCSDNCSVTTYAFLRVSPKMIQSVSKSSQGLSVYTQDFGLFNRTSYSMTLSTPCASRDKSGLNINVCYNDTSFPLFPEDGDDSDHANCARSTLCALEEWLFHQGLFGKNFYKIPDGIAALPSKKKVVKDEKKGKKNGKNGKEAPEGLKLIQLLTNLVGTRLTSYISISRDIPEDTIQRVNYVYNVYHNSKQFILTHGGFLPHVSPEYLLTYADYVIFKESVQPLRPDRSQDKSAVLGKTDFYRLTKQCWMDVILQTFKVFVLFRICVVKEEGSTEQSNVESQLDIEDFDREMSEYSQLISILARTMNRSHQKSIPTSVTSDMSDLKTEQPEHSLTFWKSYQLAKPRNCDVLSESECILLHWLQYNFNKYRVQLWGSNNGEVPEERYVQFFNADLGDGLVLMAVTFAYCPYLKPYLVDAYLQPKSVEELYHNASKVLQCWNLIGLSFTLAVSQIIQPNALQMLMLVTYLYDVLPTFYPNTVINLKTGLSTTCSEPINVQNLSDFPINYRMIFFGNERGFFGASKQSFSIEPKHTGAVEVNFQARKIQTEEVTLILNGESLGQRYAKSMAFKLVGEPDPSYCTTTITIPISLYQVLDVDLAIQSPYLVTALYDTHYTLTEPRDVRTCKIIPWEVEKRRKIPKRMMISDPTEVQFDDDGIGRFVLTVCTFNLVENPFWLFFTNSEVGDFAVKVVTATKVDQERCPVLPISLPSKFKLLSCSCNQGNGISLVRRSCPRLVSVKVPCKNELLWGAVREMLVKVVDEKDVPFWEQYLGTKAGTKVCKWMIDLEKDDKPNEIAEIFETKLNYTVELDESFTALKMPPFTTVENVQSQDYHDIPVHISDTKGLQEFQFTMTSEKGVEARLYRVVFVIEKDHASGTLAEGETSELE